MNINIQISENGVVTRSQGDQSSGDNNQISGASSGHQDGGAPNVQQTGADNTQSGGSDVTDIGAPPQWLYDAVSNASGSQTSGVSSADGSDAGGPPSFE